MQRDQGLGIFDRAPVAGFVGRQAVQDAFRRNLERTESGSAMVLGGVLGVGKTEALRKLRDIAGREYDAFVVCCDGRSDNPLDAIESISRNLSAEHQTVKDLRGFCSDLTSYRRECERRAGSVAPDGGAVFEDAEMDVDSSREGWKKVAVRGRLRLGRLRQRSMLKKIASAPSPEAYWTGRLANLVDRISGNARVVWLVDNFEVDRHGLGPWLLDLLRAKCSGGDSRWVAVVAGSRDPRPVAARVGAGATPHTLEVFTRDEVEQFLRNRGVDEARIAAVQSELGGLALHLDLAVSGNADLRSRSVGVAGSVADLLLQHIDDPAQRQLCLDAATSRILTENIVAIIVGDEAAREAFVWLTSQPFIEPPNADIPYYHYESNIRDIFVSYNRSMHPERPYEIHRKLAGCRTSVVVYRHVVVGAKWDDVDLREADDDRAFHSVAGAAGDAFTCAVDEVLMAHYRGDPQHGCRVASSVAQALVERREVGRAETILMLRDAIEFGRGETFNSMVPEIEGLELGSMARSEFCWLKFTSGGKVEELLVAEALECDEFNVYALAEVAQRLLRRGEVDRALEKINEALRWRTWDNPDLYYVRAQIYSAIGRKNDACDELLNAAEIARRRNDGAFIAHVGSVLRDEFGEHTKVVAVLTRALMKDLDNAYLLAERGATYLAMGDCSGAVRDLEDAVQLDPHDSWAQTLLARTYADMGHDDKGLPVLDRIIEAAPHCAFPYVTRAQLLAARQKYDAAVVDLTRAIECCDVVDEECVPPSELLQLRGFVYRAQGDLEAAVQDFTAALEDGSHPGVLHSRGAALHDLGELSAAVDDFTEAIRAEPESCGNHVHKALVLVEMGEWNEARECFRHAVDLEPAGLSLVCLALVEAWLGDVSAVEARLASWGSVDLSDIPAAGLMAFGRWMHGDRERAVDIAAAALADAEPLESEGPDVERFGHSLVRFVLGDAPGAGEILRGLARESAWVVNVVRVAEMFEPLRPLLDEDPEPD